MGLQFLVRGALDYGEPGVLMAFEETTAALTQNVASLGWDLDDLIARGLLVIDRVSVSPGEIVESGEWDLDGLMLRIGAAIDAVGAKRVVLDTIEVLFGALSNERLLRSELRRLFGWLNERGVSAIVTGESGGGKSFTRYGLEEYVSDCVIVLDQRLIEQIATRRMRIAKYRGSAHGTDEYPVFTDRVSLGVPGLDEMLSGGAYRGTSVLLSGNPGSGKTTVGASFVAAACERGERALLFTFEESADQIVRNMASVGLDLAHWREQGLLRIVASRSAAYGLERHLACCSRRCRSASGASTPAGRSCSQTPISVASSRLRCRGWLEERSPNFFLPTAKLTPARHSLTAAPANLPTCPSCETRPASSSRSPCSYVAFREAARPRAA